MDCKRKTKFVLFFLIKFPFSQWLEENWEKRAKILNIEKPIQIFGNFVQDIDLNDLLHWNKEKMAWVFMKSLFSQGLEERSQKMLDC